MMDPMMPMPLPSAPLAPSAASDPALDQVATMFPDYDRGILAQVLGFHSGNVEAAVSALLEMGDASAAPDAHTEADVGASLDEEMARQFQLELDDQMARAVQEELSKEVQAEEAARRQNDPSVRAMAAASRGASTAAAQTKRLLQMAARPLSARMKKESGSRLLDSDAAAMDAPLSSPLQSAMSPSSQYIAPLAPMYSAPPPSSLSGGDAIAHLGPAGAADAPSTPPEHHLWQTPLDAATPPEHKYASRVSRAKAANRQRGLSTTSSTLSGGGSAVEAGPTEPTVEPLPMVRPEPVPAGAVTRTNATTQPVTSQVREGNLIGELI